MLTLKLFQVFENSNTFQFCRIYLKNSWNMYFMLLFLKLFFIQHECLTTKILFQVQPHNISPFVSWKKRLTHMSGNQSKEKHFHFIWNHLSTGCYLIFVYFVVFCFSIFLIFFLLLLFPLFNVCICAERKSDIKHINKFVLYCQRK